MKKRSGRKARRSRHELTFFIDRCLGAKKFPGELRSQGVSLVTYRAAYPDSPDVSDLEWIRYACKEGFVGLTHDRAIRLDEETVRGVFDPSYEPSSALILLRGDLSSLELAQMFLVARTRIESMVHRYRKRRRAFIAIVRRRTRKGGREVIEVHRWKDKEEWEEMMRRKRRRR